MKLIELSSVANMIRKRIRGDWDLSIAITGEEGSGKSTLGVLLSMAIDENFSMNKSVLFSPTEDEIKKKIVTSDKYSIILVDEAIKVLYKLNWNSKIQIMLNQIYALARKENKVSIFCIPRFTDLNEYFRNHRIKLWIHVIERGKALIFVRDTNPIINDPWHIDNLRRNLKLQWKFSKKIFADFPIHEQMKFLEKSPCFMGMIKYGKVSTKLWKEYEIARDKVKYDGLTVDAETTNKHERMWRGRCIRLIWGLRHLDKETFTFTFINKLLSREGSGNVMDAIRRLKDWDTEEKQVEQDLFYLINKKNTNLSNFLIKGGYLNNTTQFAELCSDKEGNNGSDSRKAT